MASKTIMVQEDTYNKLLQLKRKNESFNDLILRIISQKQDLMQYAGLLNSSEGDQLEQALTDIEAAMDRADHERDQGDGDA